MRAALVPGAGLTARPRSGCALAATIRPTAIHPLRLCEEIKNFMQREAILTVDREGILLLQQFA
jgi:hypothetical protein